MNKLSPRIRPRFVGFALALMTLAAPAASQSSPGQSADGGGARNDHVWRDPEGEPLPFQSDAQILDFLADADIEAVEAIELGVTNPRQVLLSRDGVNMRAVLRDYDETYTQRRIDGVFYARLRDSYTFDVAAYEMSRILGLDNVPPVTLRRVGGGQVSLQAWVEGALMESDRIAEDIQPPSARDFLHRTQNMRVFDTLIGNVDRNTGNILYDDNWFHWLIDHSRSFMRNDDTRYLERITGVSRSLYRRTRELTREELLPRLSPPLTASEVDWILVRRDKVVAHIEALIAQRGEDAVLFDSSP